MSCSAAPGLRLQKWFAFLVLGTLNVALLVGGAFAMKYFEAGPEQLRNEHYTQIAQRIDDFYRNCSKPNLPYSEIWNSSNCSNIYKEHRCVVWKCTAMDGWQWCGAVWCDGWGGAVQCGRERSSCGGPANN